MAIPTSGVEYKLRCSIRGHTADVRAVASTSNNEVITVSRDFSAKLWRPDAENGNNFNLVTEFEGHTNYVTCVCVIPPSEIFPEGLIVTGSRDNRVLIYHPEMSCALKEISHHTDTVSCLSVNEDRLVSGSWDSTVRVYEVCNINNDIINSKFELSGKHTGPIWSVMALPNNEGVLTGGADTNIYLWKNGAVTKHYKGHGDCVRGMDLIDSKSFLSCSNDASIRHWDIETGLCVASYYGHSSFIYSISSFNSHASEGPLFVTSSEDFTFKVWGNEGSQLQTINLPCETNWCVTTLPNGDVAVGSNDGVCRVFTLSSDRTASDEDLASFSSDVSKAARPNLHGIINEEQLSDKLALHKPGTKDGQTIMIKEDGVVMCYSWSSSKMVWEKVGEVVGGSGGDNASSGKVLHEGKEYDYVFDVALDEGYKLKLPYNMADDPYMIAQQFIHKHELPQDQLETVANFIITNSNRDGALASSSSTGYYDPFTGGNRYVPDGSSTSSGNTGSSDPFTASGGYIPPSSAPMEVTQLDESCPHFPQRSPLFFSSFNAVGMRRKFEQHNQQEENVKFKLSDGEIESIFSTIFNGADPRERIEPLQLVSLEKAFNWNERKWPALDLLRLCIRCEEVQKVWLDGEKGKQIMDLLMSSTADRSHSNCEIYLAFRCLSNLAAHPIGSGLLLKRFREAKDGLPLLEKVFPRDDKNIQIAAATLLLNVAVLITKNGLNEDSLVLEPLIMSLATFFNQKAIAAEGAYRALVALGTLMSDRSKEMPRKMAYISGVYEYILDLLNDRSQPPKNIDCGQTLIRILKTGQ